MLMLLMQDHSIVYTNHWVDFYRDIEYLVLPSDQQLGTYILLPPNKYLRDMREAYVEYDLIITQFEHMDDNEYRFPVSTKKVHVDSIQEFVITLSSLLKLDYMDYLWVDTETDDLSYIQFQFLRFKLEILDESGKVSYHYLEEDKPVEIIELLRDIKDVFHPYHINGIHANPKKPDDQYLLINDKKRQWKFSKVFLKDSVCGISLRFSTTYTFYHPELIQLIEKWIFMVVLQCGYFIGDECMDAFDVYLTTLEDVIEFILYNSYLMIAYKAMYEILMKDKEGESSFNIIASIELNDKGEISRKITPEDPFTLSELVQLLMKGKYNE